MRKFDTKVQYLKYKVLREVARQAWNDTLLDNVMSIPRELAPRNAETIYCCVYKERAILSERVRMAMGGNKQNPNVIEVIDIACDECPMGGYEVTNSCRGCLARRCEDACPKGAITFHNHVAHIDKAKCVDCGACARVCPYSAIVDRKRPCENACKIKAITMNENKAAAIDNNTCISCGACVYQCPFGAITDKSYILNVIDMIKKSGDNEKYHVYAVIAPSISSQFTYAKLGQVVTGLHRLGFYSVAEAALGADMVADAESRELVEFFREIANKELECKVSGFSSEARKALLTHSWPGNVRELRQKIMGAVLQAQTGLVTKEHLELGITETTSVTGFSLRNDEEDKERIIRALKQADGNRKVAAELLGIGRTTLYNKLEEYGLKYKFEQP